MNENDLAEVFRQADQVFHAVSLEREELHRAVMPARQQSEYSLGGVRQTLGQISELARSVEQVNADIASARSACESAQRHDWIAGIDGYVSAAEGRRQEVSNILDAYHLLEASYELGTAVDALHAEANSTFEHNSRPEHVGNVDAMGRQREALMVVRERAVGLIEHAYRLFEIPRNELLPYWFADYLNGTKSDLDSQFEIIDAYVKALDEELARR
ncbi:hypothetical protein ACOZFM_28690 [Streptomyces arboris]|uniref:hypothetical protein n=1 Tax=Streptomyces arboris TaxID=2600619 RepID=UPI003BF5615E